MCSRVRLFSCAAFALLSAACSVFDARLIDIDASAQNGANRQAPTPPSDAGVSASNAGARALGQAGQAGIATGAASACVASNTTDYCSSLPKLSAAPVIDGKLECGLRLQPITKAGWNGAAPPPTMHASYAAAWRPEGLYLYVEVSGQPVSAHPAGQAPFCGDAVELYVDAQDAADEDAGTYTMGTMQFVIVAPTPNATMEAARFSQGVPQGAWISNNFRTSSTPDGYNVEAIITAADVGLWQWTPSARLGFSVAIDVAGTPADSHLRCGLQAGQYFLKVSDATNGCTGEPWCDVRAFCSASLLQ